MGGTLPAARGQLRDLPLARGRPHEDAHHVAAALEVHRPQADAVIAGALAHTALDQPDELAGAGPTAELDLDPRGLAQAVGDHERALRGAAEGLRVEPEG